MAHRPSARPWNLVVRVTWLALAMSTGCWGDDSGGDCVLRGLPCDIREAGCQDAIYKATACVAEMDAGKSPRIRTIPLSELEREIRALAESDPPSETQASWDTALKLLGLLSETTDSTEASVDAAVESLLAYYDNDSKQVTVIDRGSSDPGEDLFTLSHELVHALRDARTGLGEFRERSATSTDSAAAVRSLVEGEAMVVAAALVRQVAGDPVHESLWDEVTPALEASVRSRIDASDEPFVIALQNLPYLYGTRRIGPAWTKGRRAVIDDLYARPDLSLLNWTAPLVERRDAEPLDCFPTAPPDGYVGEDSDSLGLAAVLALPVALGTSQARSAEPASWHWRDDRIVVFRPADDPGDPARAVAWRIRFDSGGDAEAFSESVGCCLSEGTTRTRDDRELSILAASDPAVVQSWTHAGDCGREEDLPVASGGAMDAMMEGRLSPRRGLRAPRPRHTPRSRRRTRARRRR